MKSIIFLIFIIISFSIIASKRLTPEDVFKGSKSHQSNVQNWKQRNKEKTSFGPPTTNNAHASTIVKKPKIW